MTIEQPKTIEQEEIGTIKGIAERVIQGNSEYSEDLLELIPEELLNADTTNESLYTVADKLDVIRSKKKEELEKMREKFEEKDREELEKRKREIQFLFNVAASILHQ